MGIKSHATEHERWKDEGNEEKIAMDKQMKKVTKSIQKAESSLKKAEKKNISLTAKDKKRDSYIHKCKKSGV
jgi:hypothetical protein